MCCFCFQDNVPMRSTFKYESGSDISDSDDSFGKSFLKKPVVLAASHSLGHLSYQVTLTAVLVMSFSGWVVRRVTTPVRNAVRWYVKT